MNISTTKNTPVYYSTDNLLTNPVTPVETNANNQLSNLKQQMSYSEGLYLKTYATLGKYLRKNRLGLTLRGDKVYEQFSIEEFLKKRGVSLERFLMQLKANNVRYLKPGVNNYLDENIILTPMPYINRQLLVTHKETNDYLTAERGAVLLRTFEYTHGLRSREMNREMKSEMMLLISEAAQTIQTWWKSKAKLSNINHYTEKKEFNRPQYEEIEAELIKQHAFYLLKWFNSVIQKKVYLNQKEFIDRMKYSLRAKQDISEKPPKIVNEGSKAKITKKNFLKLNLIESRDRFSLLKEIHYPVYSLRRNRSNNDRVTLKRVTEVKKIKPLLGVQTANDFTITNQNSPTIRIIATNWKGMKMNREMVFSYDTKPAQLEKSKLKPNSKNPETEATNVSNRKVLSPLHNDNEPLMNKNPQEVNQAILNDNQFTISQEQCLHKLRNQPRPGNNAFGNSLDKGNSSLFLFPDGLNIVNSSTENNKPTSTNNQYPSKSINSLHNKTKEGFDYISLSVLLNTMLKQKQRLSMKDSFNKLRGQDEYLTIRHNNDILNNRLHVLMLFNRMKRIKSKRSRCRMYFLKWKQLLQITSKANLRIKSFSHSIESSRNNSNRQLNSNETENDIQTLKTLMLLQKIKKCFQKRRYLILHLLSHLFSKKELSRSMSKINDSSFSINSYSFNLLSMRNINKGLRLLSSMIQLKYSRRLFHRIALSYLLSHRVNLSNEPIINLLQYGSNNSAYNKTLNGILKQRVTNNYYAPHKLPFTFVEYVKKLVSIGEEEENKQQLTFKKKVSPVKTKEIREVNVEDEENDLDAIIYKSKNERRSLRSSVKSFSLNSERTKKHNPTEFLPKGVKEAYSLLHSGLNKKTPNQILLREEKDQKEID